MPRTGRLNLPGGLFHIIGRGFEKRDIFSETCDKRDFLRRLAKSIKESDHQCFAWAIMDNHYHLLVCQGSETLSDLLGPVLGGFALAYNKRHDRVGYVFQGRFKSILCDENSYFLELIRYIHLNPIRGGIITSLTELARYPWTGHACLIGHHQLGWYDREAVLSRFAAREKSAVTRYLRFMQATCEKEDYMTSYEGKAVFVKQTGPVAGKLSADRHRRLGDDRILGDDTFVEQVLKQQHKCTADSRFTKDDIDQLIDAVCEYCSVSKDSLMGRSKSRSTAHARAIICFHAVKDLGFSTNRVSEILNISHQAVSQAVMRGKTLEDACNLATYLDK